MVLTFGLQMDVDVDEIKIALDQVAFLLFTTRSRVLRAQYDLSDQCTLSSGAACT